MASKRPASLDAPDSQPKQQRRKLHPRKVLPLAEKIKLLDMLQKGQGSTAVGRHFGISESTVRGIKKNEERIRGSISDSMDLSRKVIFPRNKDIVRMESALALWIKDCSKKNICLCSESIRQKARHLYDTLAAEGDNASEEPRPGPSSEESKAQPGTFLASKGWFCRFQKRLNIKNIALDSYVISDKKEAANDLTSDTSVDDEDEPEPVSDKDKTAVRGRRIPRTFVIEDKSQSPELNEGNDNPEEPQPGPSVAESSSKQREFKTSKEWLRRSKRRFSIFSLKGKAVSAEAETAKDFEGFSPDEISHSAREKAVKLARFLKRKDFDDVTCDEVDNHNNTNPNSLDIDLVESVKGLSEVESNLFDKDKPSQSVREVESSLVDEDLSEPAKSPEEESSLVDEDLSEPVKSPEVDEGLSEPVKSQEVDEGLSEPIKSPQVDEYLSEPIKSPEVDEGLGEPVKSPQVDENLSEPVKSPQVDEGLGEPVKSPQVDEGLSEPVKSPEVDEGLGEPVKSPEVDEDLSEPAMSPEVDEDLSEPVESPSEMDEVESNLVNKDLSEPEKFQGEMDEVEEGLSLKQLELLMKTAKRLQRMAEFWDPSMVRALQFQEDIGGAVEDYKNLLVKQKKERQKMPIILNIMSLTEVDFHRLECSSPEDV